MIPPLETYVVVSLAFAVFAAVTSVGAAIVLGVGYERLRAGLEKVKEGLDLLNRQTGFFSTALFKLENRVDAIDKVQIQPAVSDAPKTTRKTKARTSRSKKSVTQVDELPSSTILTSQDDGNITITVPGTDSHNWQSYQGLSKDEALANFANSSHADGKIKFM
jgi:putative ubiquitin-RnfH superfamily antitoxin RatB of RatAB toxin-antitoxin module